MKYCKRCGKPIDDFQIFCPYCGQNQADNSSQNSGFYGQNGYSQNNYGQNGYGQNGYRQNGYTTPSANTKVDTFVTVLCFLIPIAALIFYFVYRYSNINRAHSAVKGALGSLSFLFPVIGIVLMLLIRDTYPQYYKMVRNSTIAGIIAILLQIVIIIIISIAGGFGEVTTPQTNPPSPQKPNGDLIYFFRQFFI